jgi:hypothetical protein
MPNPSTRVNDGATVLGWLTVADNGTVAMVPLPSPLAIINAWQTVGEWLGSGSPRDKGLDGWRVATTKFCATPQPPDAATCRHLNYHATLPKTTGPIATRGICYQSAPHGARSRHTVAASVPVCKMLTGEIEDRAGTKWLQKRPAGPVRTPRTWNDPHDGSGLVLENT